MQPAGIEAALLSESAINNDSYSNSPKTHIQYSTVSPPGNQGSSRIYRGPESLSQPRDRVPSGGALTQGSAQQQGSSGGESETVPSRCRSVHAIIGVIQYEDSKEGFFGNTSAGTFMQSVKRIVEQKYKSCTHGMSPDIGRAHNHLPPLIPDRKSKHKQIEYVLPTRKKADRLMDLYWKYVHILYPHLDKEQTQKNYEQIWNGCDDNSVSDEQSLLCLLNIIFALSSQIDTQIAFEDRGSVAAMYYDRAYELMDIRDTGSIRAVQSFLLLGQYFQSTNEPHPCWIFVGLGIRTAQSLGLHQAETSQRVPDVRTREILRRVWHGCILMDRILSMTYGRPCSIGPNATNSVPLPRPMDQEYVPVGVDLRYASRGTEGRPSFVDFYILSLKLYDFLDDVLFNYHTVETPNDQQPRDALQNAHLGQCSTERITAVFELERRLSKWEASIPEHLRIHKRPAGAVGVEAILYRQAVVLHQRHIYVRLLLLRPILSTVIGSERYDEKPSTLFGGLLADRILLQCAVECVHAAQAAIDVVYAEEATLNEGSYYLSAWWYNVLFLYTSATILIAARLSPDILTEIPERKILESWHKAIGILEGYCAFSTSIQRLVTTLGLLSNAVPQRYSRLRQQQPIRQPEKITSSSMTPVSMSAALWRPSDVTSIPATSLGQEVTVDFLCEAGGELDKTLMAGSLLDFDNVFDPNDLSWLLTVPFNS
ncbi:uncharacterized protein A1O9_01036 [Exophiala aquamarina CBS 119918]|uniref:Xylanolytic transcriptional activator regulatory domain-containing protein n=1 Tax=Exophiala aquamarina CBS 119918 TaxID=1182545 RepID=A0A072Q556_9EURO|nr:uncharacterized protein A1O9_01036 [Exophiala aquamarina CBS 119918]KEF63060.1 hypothetical protein A1O9_01036 [Exophiala aquamarina CBS 119918]